MEIFGTIDPYDHYGRNWKNTRKKLVGLNLANYAFIQAILKYGTFDEYHFFLRSESHLGKFADFCRGLELPPDKSRRIRPKIYRDLPVISQKYRYTAFHHYDPAISATTYFRQTQFPHSPFPVTGMVHTISLPPVYEMLLKVLLGATTAYDTLICPSQALKTALGKYFQELSLSLKAAHGANISFQGKLEVIPLGIDTEKFRPRDKRELRSRLGLPLDQTLIAYIGRLSPVNKMEILPLLYAFKNTLANARNRESKLLIVGQEQLKGYVAVLKAVVRKLGLAAHVIFINEFDQDNIPLYYAAADIFVSPSDNTQETFGLTPIEAMASGLPVIISDWNGYKEAVTHEVNGFKVPTYWAPCNSEAELLNPLPDRANPIIFDLAQSVALDIDKLTEYLILLVDNAGLRKKIGAAAREEARRHYDWKVIVPQLEKLWRSRAAACRRAGKLRPAARPIFKIPYFQLFGHYATAILDDDTEIKVSSFGEAVEGKKASFPTYKLLLAVADQALINQIMDSARQWTKIKKLTGAPREKILYQVMFLLKYNLLECRQN